VTKKLIAGVALIAILLGGLILVLSKRPTSPITVCHVKSIHSAEGIRTTFVISNYTRSPYVVVPLEVEAQENGTWRRCFFFTDRLSSSPSAITQDDMVGPKGFASRVYEVTNIPLEVPLRLRVVINRELTGVRGWWERYLYHNFQVPLKYTHVFDHKVYQITSEEFIEPKR
jgi:hypothetical protein